MNSCLDLSCCYSCASLFACAAKECIHHRLPARNEETLKCHNLVTQKQSEGVWFRGYFNDV